LSLTIRFVASQGAAFPIARRLIETEKRETFMIYIATDIHGRGTRHVFAYDSRDDFARTAKQWLDRSDGYFQIKARSTVNDICDALFDSGQGFGARSHRRVSRKEALRLKRDGVNSHGF